MDAQVLGAKIAELRKKKGITQKQLAERLHVTDGAVSKWERGINYPDLSMLESIAAELDSDMISLLALEASTADQILRTITDLSVQERGDLVRQLRFRGYYKLLLEVLILAAFFVAARIFRDHGIYGFAQTVTLGMGSFVGCLIGSEIYTLINLPKLR